MHSRTWNWGVIALGVYATAGLAAIAGIVTLLLSLAAEGWTNGDWANGDSFPLAIPFLLILAAPLVFVGASIVLPLAIWALQGTDLDRSIPRVGMVTIVGAALTSPLLSILSLPVTMLIGTAALLWARSSPRFRLKGFELWDQPVGARRLP